jgi:hypothetical protein
MRQYLSSVRIASTCGRAGRPLVGMAAFNGRAEFQSFEKIFRKRYAMKLKLTDTAVFSLRIALEAALGDGSSESYASYTDLLEQTVISRLLRRKTLLFNYPKAVNVLTLDIAEAAVLYRLMLIDSTFIDISLSRRLIDAIGRRLPSACCR